MSSQKPRILLYGRFWSATIERCWLEWLEQHEYPVYAFDHDVPVQRIALHNTLAKRVLRRFSPNLVASYVSRHLMNAVLSFRPDLVLVVAGRAVTQNVVRKIQTDTDASVFHFYNDDFFNSSTTTSTLRQAATYYDHFFTTKSFSVSELKQIGCKQVTYIPHGYRPNCHYPVSVTADDIQQYGSDVVFIGGWETERASVIAQLGDFDLRIWGAAWHKAGKRYPLRHAIQNRAVFCEDMSKVFNASKVCLAFLRKANRDRHTSRTFEIPACGGFQLSERTDEVLAFFDEGHEIECFSSVEELKDKARYYLKHDANRQRIAAAGLARVKRSKYSFTDRLETILSYYK